MKMTQDEKYMKAAIREAKKAYALDEVPGSLTVEYQEKYLQVL